MKPLPMPVRIAAGLVATAVEQARELPRLVTELPVTAVSQALQASMRVQQRVTELAIKGDRALSALRPVSDAPDWATFDDEPATTNGRPEPAVTDPGSAVSAGTAASTTASAAAGDVAGAAAPAAERSDDDSAGPNVLPGYPSLTIPQLRGRLRQLGVDELRTLLQWEISHDNRPPYVTMLGNRIVTLTEE